MATLSPMLHHDAQRKITMVHAGIPPVWTIDQAIKQAELEQALGLKTMSNLKYFQKH